MVEARLKEVDVILHSARDVKDVNYLSRMESFATLKFAPYVDYTTRVDHEGGVNPTWNEKFGFMIPEAVLQRGEGNLKLEILTLSTLGTKFVCEASIPLADISFLPRLNEPFLKKYPLKTNSGDFQGEVLISFAVGDKVLSKVGDRETAFPIFTGSGKTPYSTGQQAQVPGLGPPSPSQPPMFSRPSQAIPQLAPPPRLVTPSDLTPLSPAKPFGFGTAQQKPMPAILPPARPPPPRVDPYKQTGIPLQEAQSPYINIVPIAPSNPSWIQGPLVTTPTPLTSATSPGVINVPIQKIDGPSAIAGSYGNVGRPLASSNLLFGGPLGKLLLTDLTRGRTVGGGY